MTWTGGPAAPATVLAASTDDRTDSGVKPSADVEPKAEPDVTLVLPTYNENPVVIDTLTQALDHLRAEWTVEAIVVDDGSTDGTPAAVRETFPDASVRVHERPGRPADLGQSVLDGVRAANGRAVLVMDADGQHPPERAPDVVRPVAAGEADACVAVRESVAGDWPLHRRIVSAGAKRLANLLLPATVPRVSDPLSGFFAVDRTILAGHLSALPTDPIGYKVLLELLAVDGVDRVVEVGYDFRERQGGESNLDLREYVKFLRHLRSIRGRHG